MNPEPLGAVQETAQACFPVIVGGREGVGLRYFFGGSQEP